MRISAVNPTMYRQNNLAFQGLWGREERRVLEEPVYSHGLEADVGTSHILTVKFYYPFADETKEDIEKVRKEHTGIKYTPADKNPMALDFADHINEKRVVIMKNLPFTEKEYIDYKARNLLSKEEMKISDQLKTARLQKYLL